jgi:hypothetical protein
MITTGQITIDSPLGKFLNEQAKSAHTILEVGTGSGLGSTQCLAEGMEKSAVLYTVEGNKEQFLVAESNINPLVEKGHRIVLYYGILHRMILPYSHPHDSPVIREMYNAEKRMVRVAPLVTPVIPVINTIDLLFLDGGEWTSIGDFLLLWIKATVIVIDDCNPEKAVKNVAALHFMHQNPAFRPIRMELGDRNGWAAFVRRVS